MNSRLLKYGAVIISYIAVLYPLWIVTKNLDSLSPMEIFPVFGILAFTLLWLHSMSGVFETWLRRNFNFDRFVHATSVVILVCIILHPLLFLINYSFDFNKINLYWDAKYIRIGIIGWILLISYDIFKPFKKRGFFSRNWNNILTISTIGFILIFFHSLGLGGELKSGPLHILWLFYGITGILATIYTYGLKRTSKN